MMGAATNGVAETLVPLSSGPGLPLPLDQAGAIATRIEAGDSDLGRAVAALRAGLNH